MKGIESMKTERLEDATGLKQPWDEQSAVPALAIAGEFGADDALYHIHQAHMERGLQLEEQALKARSHRSTESMPHKRQRWGGGDDDAGLDNFSLLVMPIAILVQVELFGFKGRVCLSP